MELRRLPHIYRKTSQRIHHRSEHPYATTRHVFQHPTPVNETFHHHSQQQSKPHPSNDQFWPQGFAQTPAPTVELTSSVSHGNNTLADQTKESAGSGRTSVIRREVHAQRLLLSLSFRSVDEATLGLFVPVGIARSDWERSFC